MWDVEVQHEDALAPWQVSPSNFHPLAVCSASNGPLSESNLNCTNNHRILGQLTELASNSHISKTETKLHQQETDVTAWGRCDGHPAQHREMLTKRCQQTGDKTSNLKAALWARGAQIWPTPPPFCLWYVRCDMNWSSAAEQCIPTLGSEKLRHFSQLKIMSYGLNNDNMHQTECSALLQRQVRSNADGTVYIWQLSFHSPAIVLYRTCRVSSLFLWPTFKVKQIRLQQ